METFNIDKIFVAVEKFGQDNGASPREVNTLRLLAEEAKNMITELIKNPAGEFSITKEDRQYQLHFTVNSSVHKKDQKEFLTLSKDKKNIYRVGVLGKIAGAMSSIFAAYAEASAMMYSSVNTASYVTPNFSMNAYIYSLSEIEKKAEWDGLERSILVNLSDDILVGAKSNQVELIVKKTFA